MAAPTNGKCLTRDEFFKRPELKTEAVEIEGLGTVRIKEFGARQKIELDREFEESGIRDTSKLTAGQAIKLFADLAARSLCDDDGNLMCQGDEDRERLQDCGFEVLEQLGNEVLRINGMIEGTGKNSPTASDSPTG